MNAAPYSAPVWAHFDNPRNIGCWRHAPPGVVTGEAGTPAGSALLRLHCRIEDSAVREARFQAHGSVAVIAVGSWLSGWLRGRGVAEARAIEVLDIAERLELAAVERYSAIMGVDALGAALKHHDQQQQSRGLQV